MTLNPGDIVITAQLGEDNYGVVRIDPLTGDRTIISDDTHGAGDAFSIVSGVALTADGALLVAEYIFGQLFRVDPATGNRTVLSGGGHGTGPSFEFVAGVHEVDERILVSGAPDGFILNVDEATGNRSYVSSFNVGSGPQPNSPGGFATIGDSAFLASNLGVIKIDLATGDRAVLPGTGMVAPMHITVGGGGFLLASTPGAVTFPGEAAINRIDPMTGEWTTLSSAAVGAGPAPSRSARGITVDNAGAIFWNQGSAVLQVDPVTGDRTILSNATHGNGPTFTNAAGILVVPNVPEPSTIMLAALGASGLLAMRVRRRSCQSPTRRQV
ncbi:MAG: PEP-CTERM sorting domain-containing protein [Planctomycetia bacterium]|nr:PEP-CTERM sorting domain-containing protein [Planctomycetia bacterium]